MSAPNYVLLENTSDIAQQVFDENGVVHSIPGLARFPFPEDVANQLLEERGQYVRIYTPMAVPQQRDVNEPLVWVANVTGDPSAPATVELEENTSKGPQLRTYNHGCHKARVIEYKMHVDQVVEKDASGYTIALNLPPVPVRLPPFEAVAVPRHVADFVVQRGASMGAELGEVIKRVRPRGEFEPNPTWAVEDIWLFMELVAGDKFNKDKLAKIINSVSGTQGAKTFAQLEELAPHKVNEVKQEVWRHSFFFLIDERYNLPTKKVFDRFKADRERKAAKLSAAETLVNEVTGDKPKKRGRPRKNA